MPTNGYRREQLRPAPSPPPPFDFPVLGNTCPACPTRSGSFRALLTQAPLGLGCLGPRSHLLAPSPPPPLPAHPAPRTHPRTGPCLLWPTLPPSVCGRKPSGVWPGKAGGFPAHSNGSPAVTVKPLYRRVRCLWQLFKRCSEWG